MSDTNSPRKEALIKFRIDNTTEMKKMAMDNLKFAKDRIADTSAKATEKTIERQATQQKNLPSLFIKIVKWIIKTIREIIKVLSTLINMIFNFFFRGNYPISHYIALFLVILFIVYALRKSTDDTPITKPNEDVRKAKNKERNFIVRFFSNLWYKIKRFFSKIFRFPFKLTKPRLGGDSKERDTNSGRCDMLDWVESGNKFCLKTKKPKDIRWYLPQDKMPELNELSIKMRDEITDNGNKLIIDIPYKLVNNKYLPNCSDMKYYNGKKVDGLLKQKDLNSDYCMIVEKKSKKYSNSKKRNVDSSNVYQLCE
jgi:hypothetical protein